MGSAALPEAVFRRHHTAPDGGHGVRGHSRVVTGRGACVDAPRLREAALCCGVVTWVTVLLLVSPFPRLSRDGQVSWKHSLL